MHFRCSAHAAAAAGLAIAVAGVAGMCGARTVGGSDSYGYVSQADAWLAGRLVEPLPDLGISAPENLLPRFVYAPLGWRPSATEPGIVPTYPAGFPLLLAAVKGVGGHPAMFLVVPLFAGVLIWATFLLGRSIAGPSTGLLAAGFVATSPTVLHQSMVTMSDVPTAALWTLSLLFVMRSGARDSLIAGLLAGFVVLIRPNLAPLAAVTGLWMLLRRDHRAWWYAVAVLPAGVVTAFINHWWFGSISQTGYGSSGELFALANAWPNVRLYVTWLVTAETPLAVVGLALVLTGRLPDRSDGWRSRSMLMATLSGTLLLIYVAYVVFDTWTYLRFLLPALPVAYIATSSLLLKWRGPGAALGAVVVAAAVIGHGLWYSSTHGVFGLGLGESRYAQVARSVADLTPADAVIVSMQHSGSLKYYGDRTIARWDWMRAADFDRAVPRLGSSGRPVYLLLDAFEVDEIRRRSAGRSSLGALDWTPIVSYFGGETFLYALSDLGRQIQTTEAGTLTRDCVRPAKANH